LQQTHKLKKYGTGIVRTCSLSHLNIAEMSDEENSQLNENLYSNQKPKENPNSNGRVEEQPHPKIWKNSSFNSLLS